MSKYEQKYPYGLTYRDFLIYDKNNRIIIHKKYRTYLIGNVYNTIHSGLYRILNISYDNHGNKKYYIEFIKTGYKTLTYHSSIKNGNIKDKYLYKLFIGKIYQNNTNKKFKIIKYTGLNKDNRFTFDVKFLHSKEIVNADIYNISIGKVRDPSLAISNKIFHHGDYEYRKNIRLLYPKLYRTLQHRWNSMIDRCYNDKNISYSSYGGKGVYVCERWHTFSNYLHDVKNLQGFDSKSIILGYLELDKDLLQLGIKNKVYSPETCIWLTTKENNSINMNKRQYK